MLARQLPRITSVQTTVRWTSTMQKHAPKIKRPTAAKQASKVEKAPPITAPSGSLKGNATGARSASTALPTPPSPPSNPSKVPGNPEPPIVSSEAFNIQIPAPETIPETPVQIPFVPDFWDSVKPSEVPKHAAEPIQPKIVVVGGAGTHHGGGPSHNLSDVSETASRGDSAAQASTKFERSESVFDDIAADLHLPPVNEIKANFWKMFP
ncbi:hypothetical protein CPB83DRAFT_841544 [Crepidotus variabilis]|uniref:Uncharacterized protein n=1 Tax=Crepidotus variabilis TaxID=179855 RepID=A0A9P6ETU1_9AGAR|nr:hypothetical protein CPB83DRAFT_841544 [Crepidotus variabilis]